MTTLPLECATLGEALRALSRSHPDTATFFPHLKAEIHATDLLAAARSVAESVLTDGSSHGEVIGVLGTPGPELLAGFFGTILAGAAATILPTPTGFRSARHSRYLAGLVAAGRITRVIADDSCQDLAIGLRELCPQLRVISTSSCRSTGAELPHPGPDDLAVVQFTSGSTSAPRGVMLPHATIFSALRSITATAHMSGSDVAAQWVPLHHDMGLFGYLTHLLNGADSHLFEPVSVLRRPETILNYMAEHRATTMTGPDFAYEILAAAAAPNAVRQRDLSAWRLAFNGSEPVNASTVRAFAEAFGPAGVGPDVMYPVYGMAEATLPVTFPTPGSTPRIVAIDREELGRTGKVILVDPASPHAKELVSVGRPVADAHVRIVDEHGQPLPPGTLGELQARGPMITTGYLNDPQATSALFADGWLRTGDLAFRFGDDHFIAGRSKEMMVVHGQNYFPEDAEAVARTVPGVYRRRAVAVPMNESDGQELLGVVVESALSGQALAALEQTVRNQIVAELGTSNVRVYMAPPRWLTTTTSGKWQRLHTAKRLQNGEWHDDVRSAHQPG